jgi:hypothetical protein
MIAACKYKMLKDTAVNGSGVVPVYFYGVNGNQILDVVYKGESLQADHTVDETQSRVDFEFALERGDELMVIYTTLPRFGETSTMTGFEAFGFESFGFE